MGEREGEVEDFSYGMFKLWRRKVLHGESS